MRLKQKVAIITGAARGIGAGAAEAFAREGARLVLTDILDEQGEAVAERLRAQGAQAEFVRHDVASEDQWKLVADRAVRLYGRIDVLVNNAGVGGKYPLDETSVEEWDRVMDINVKGPFLGIKICVGAMREAGGGSIVNVSSQLGLVGTDTSSPQYQSSKGAVRMLTKHVAIHFAPDKIRANSVHPGPIVTPMTETRRNDPERHPKILSRIPLGRYGEVDEIVPGIVFLASDESRFMTGAELVIDGGWTAQ